MQPPQRQKCSVQSSATKNEAPSHCKQWSEYGVVFGHLTLHARWRDDNWGTNLIIVESVKMVAAPAIITK